MKTLLRKSLSMLLVICMLFSMMTTAMISTFAADSTAKATPTVEIVSFMRGSQTDLRSSELLQAKVTGYDGNPQDLIYEWSNTLGTYLYVYNSHNMYYINNTDGEVEIYNNNVPSSTNMAGRSYKDTFSGEGYCWAAIYGSYTTGTGSSIEINDAYSGTISVTVKDKNGNIIGSDSHTGKVTSSGVLWWITYEYNGIVPFNLQSDMDDVTIGLFEGDKRNVKDLLGESAIVHITCVESTVKSGTIASGKDKISLTQESGDYYITGTNAGTSTDADGDAKVTLTITKNTCKFHEKASGTATTTVYVFKKPTTSTTAYTLTLTGNIDNRCRYFIDGKEGVKQADGTILFDGLNPNTQYMVEVRAEYKDENQNTRYTYAYVYDTTKPIYNGTVEVYLDGTYDSATHTASGTKVNLEDVSEYSTVYAKKTDGNEFIKLEKKDGTTGTYSSILDSGSYKLYYTADESTKIDDQILTMHDSDRTRYLFYNSVTYKDGSQELNKEFYPTGTAVKVWDKVPTKDGYVFAGWKAQNGKFYQSASELTSMIGEAYVLEAIWEEAIDVYVNITIDHYASNDGHNLDDSDRHNVAFDLMTKPKNTVGNYTDVYDSPIALEWNGTETFTNEYFNATHTDNGETDYTYYTAKAPVLKNAFEDNDYTVEIAKTDYEIKSLTTKTDENGDVTVDVLLKYEPKNADLTFTVELDEASKELVKKHPEYKPSAVHVKVLSWYTKGYNEIQPNTWEHISQHHDTFVTLNLDENGKATGSYPVWMHNSKETEFYYYRIKVVSYVLADGTVLTTNDVEGKENIEYITPDDRYLATISVTNGTNPNPQYTELTGAHFNNAEKSQQGDLKGIIHINTYDVTFDPNGGKFADNSTDSKTAKEQIVIPNLADYTVTRDGGYVFNGWEVIEGDCDNFSSGQALYSDITVRAKWKAPLTVEGLISVAGYYHLDGNKDDIHIINSVDRTHAITVYLQKLLPNGYAETVDTQKVLITYNDNNKTPIGIGNYCFNTVPDDGSQYRILIQNPNYVVKYQNEPESTDNNKVYDFENYYFYEKDTNDFIAEFTDNEPTIADVNAFLEFIPHEFALHYAIDSSKINNGFRPSDTEVLVLYDDATAVNPQRWPIITQMENGDSIKGQVTKLDADGKGNNSYDVWRTKPDGHSLYDYSIRLDKYTTNGTNTTFNPESAPFFAYYNGSARYSAVEGLNPEHQTQLLTIELAPKRYPIIFDVNFTQSETDYVTGMDHYIVVENNTYRYELGHIWSFDTDISEVIPQREGYKFLGWYDENDNLVTKIDASVHKEVTLTAKWEKIFKVTFHANNADIDDDTFRVYYQSGVDTNASNEFNLKADGSIESFYDIPVFEYYTHNNYIFKGWYLDKDNDNDSRPITFKEKYTEDTDIYAHWILVKDVNKDANDTKIFGSDKYPGYDLLGVQIRDVEKDDVAHYGEAGSGLRFVTVLSNDVYSQINALSSSNANGAEYGYALAKTETAKRYATSNDYNIQYKGANVNGKNTETDYNYVNNVRCSGVPDHYNSTDYRLYTAVVTYKNKTGDALEQAHEQKIVARSYIRYTDANGLFRTHHNNYTGTNTYYGCSASFNDAYTLLNR